MNVNTKPGGGYAVAVKRLRMKGTQGNNEWLNELKFLAKLNHPNVVKLIGYCSEREHRILVYEYMIGGSLEAHLLKAKKYSNGLEGNLVQWAKPNLSNKLDIRGVIGQRIGENFPREEAQEFARIILQLLSTDPTGRPEMREVVANLDRLENYARGGAIITNFPGTEGSHI
ncbi:hypothetical protein CMV_015757 [Castanea mollissima]|uniref:Protein kinase domain-containing protein n=1 Tax=Castanea mollissima TaxID=60419 RepID=A0A8J4VJT3_9ROSI|nr:hypothetical protein CMV_015757 [Castanea mollissima]